MLALLCLLLALASASAQECPPHYDLMEGRCIRVLDTNVATMHDQLSNYQAECREDGAHFPRIMNDADNDAYNKIGLSMYDSSLVPLDVVCNCSSRRLEWGDGTRISYIPSNIVGYENTDNINLDDDDCVATKDTVFLYPIDNPFYPKGLWVVLPSVIYTCCSTILCEYDVLSPTTSKSTLSTTMHPLNTTTTSGSSTVKTTTSSSVDTKCGEYSPMDISTEEKPCFKFFTYSLSWMEAQQRCAADFGSLLTINSDEENKYFWRTAISNNVLNGMHIGAHLVSGGSSQWTWIEDEEPAGDQAYNNFASYFPIAGGGNCTSMMTDSPSALWINENCALNKQPFICRRDGFSSLPKDCPAVAPKAGEDFYPPGFPDSNTPCGYVLIVSSGKQVELEIMTLITDQNEDFLEILEGTSGPHLIANLTGAILKPTKYKTVASNVMRVNWKPNGSGSGRGFRMHHIEVGV